MQITRSSLATGTGPADWFTGDVYVDTITNPTPPSRLQAANVHFTPGARTAWHTHPSGQNDLCPGRRRAVPTARRPRRGDPSRRPRVSSNPARITGNGAAPDRFMTHLAMLEVDEHGQGANWGEHVTDEEYNTAPAEA